MSASMGSGSGLSGLAWFKARWGRWALKVVLILGENLTQIRGVHDQDPVEDLTAYAADPAFHDRVHAGCLRSDEHDTDAFGAEHLIE